MLGRVSKIAKTGRSYFHFHFNKLVQALLRAQRWRYLIWRWNVARPCWKNIPIKLSVFLSRLQRNITLLYITLIQDRKRRIYGNCQTLKISLKLFVIFRNFLKLIKTITINYLPIWWLESKFFQNCSSSFNFWIAGWRKSKFEISFGYSSEKIHFWPIIIKPKCVCETYIHLQGVSVRLSNNVIGFFMAIIVHFWTCHNYAIFCRV